MTVTPGISAALLPRDLDSTCGKDPEEFCKWVYEHTGGNRVLSEMADWLIGKPLGVITVVAIALLLQIITRRWVGRVVSRVVDPPAQVLSRLEQFGLGMPDDAAAEQRRRSRAASLATAISSAMAVVIWVATAIVVIGIMGLQLGPLLAGAGVAGVALGFGSQSLVKDCLNGIFMLFEDQYGIGDTVDLGEAAGVVEKISLRATVLRSVDGTRWHVPNGEVRRVGNRTQLWSAAIVDVQVPHGADVAKAKELLKATADRICQGEPFDETVQEEPKVLGVEALSATGVTLRLLVKTAPGSQWALQRALREGIQDAFVHSDLDLLDLFGTARPGIDPHAPGL